MQYMRYLRRAGLFLALIHQVTASEIERNDFYRLTDCPPSSCTPMKWENSRSTMACLVLCSAEELCAMVSYSNESLCEHFDYICAQKTTKNCSHIAPMVQFYRKKVCGTKGTWIDATKECICRQGWVGYGCDRRAYNCQELLDWGYTAGEYPITLDLYRDMTRTARVYCRVRADLSLDTIVLRSESATSYNKSWDEYVSGFWNNNLNIWSGLEALHVLSQQNVGRLQFAVSFYQAGDSHFQIGCSYFNVSGATEGYSYTSECSESYSTGNVSLYYTMQDFFAVSENTKFSAYNHDMDDDDTRNCAAEAGAGWWFKSCEDGVNPFGFDYMSRPSNKNEKYHISIPDISFNDSHVAERMNLIEMYFYDGP